MLYVAGSVTRQLWNECNWLKGDEWRVSECGEPWVTDDGSSAKFLFFFKSKIANIAELGTVLKASSYVNKFELKIHKLQLKK